MQPPLTNWQKAFKTRTTLQQQLNIISEALATNNKNEIILSLNNLINVTGELKQNYYELESKEKITQTYLDSCC